MTPQQAAALSEAIRLQQDHRWEHALALALPLSAQLPTNVTVQNLAGVLLAQGGRHRVSDSPLFDNARLARDWHELVRHIWRQHCAIGWPTMPV